MKSAVSTIRATRRCEGERLEIRARIRRSSSGCGRAEPWRGRQDDQASSVRPDGRLAGPDFAPRMPQAYVYGRCG